MKVLKNHIISISKAGTRQLAVIEGISSGYVTVRLGRKGTGARLTNLYAVGALNIGDVVEVDYSTAKPYVRSISGNSSTSTVTRKYTVSHPLEKYEG